MVRLLFACTAVLVAILPAAASAQDYSATSAVTRDVASDYLQAYIARDWDRLETLLGDEASFEDPTAKLVFGGGIRQGKPAMMTMFREGYSSITDMRFDEQLRFAAGNIAVFEGVLTWTALHQGGVPVTAEMPFVVILEVEDGKVVSHRDHADYAPYLEARAAAFGN